MSFAGDGPVAYLDGELDMVTVQGLAERLSPQVEAGRTLTVNLSGITFIGSSGLQALADLQHRATVCGGSLRLAEVPWLVRRVLEITGMQNGFFIEPSARRA
jgi:anti-sigma B factor antagonist